MDDDGYLQSSCVFDGSRDGGAACGGPAAVPGGRGGVDAVLLHVRQPTMVPATGALCCDPDLTFGSEKLLDVQHDSLTVAVIRSLGVGFTCIARTP